MFHMDYVAKVALLNGGPKEEQPNNILLVGMTKSLGPPKGRPWVFFIGVMVKSVFAKITDAK